MAFTFAAAVAFSSRVGSERTWCRISVDFGIPNAELICSIRLVNWFWLDLYACHATEAEFIYI